MYSEIGDETAQSEHQIQCALFCMILGLAMITTPLAIAAHDGIDSGSPTAAAASAMSVGVITVALACCYMRQKHAMMDEELGHDSSRTLGCC